MYLKSEQHRVNYLAAGKLGRERKIELALMRQQEYDNDPKLCKFCNVALSYKEHKSKSFCNSSCAAKFNNKGRIKSEETIRKTKETFKNKKSCNLTLTKRQCVGRQLKLRFSFKEVKPAKKVKKKTKMYCNVAFPSCKVCKKVFCYNVKQGSRKEVRKTCSEQCKVQAITGDRKYINGKKTGSLYFNRFENKNVFLDSSWEVEIAKLLDKKDIKWIRPKYIKWRDDDNKARMYYPDFYLIDYDVYLDPKNPYCMIQGKRKMEIVSKQVSLVYGALEVIIKFINNLKQNASVAELV